MGCYPIYMMGLFLKYMKSCGGVEHFDKLAEQRSTMFYDCIESSGGFYKAPVDPACRSRVNVPFVIKDDDPALTKVSCRGGGRELRSACRPSLRGWVPCVALQCDARRGCGEARPVHEEVPGSQFLRHWRCPVRELRFGTRFAGSIAYIG